MTEERVEFRVSPERYKHWRMSCDGPVATLVMDVDEQGGLVPGYELKLNSYDLGVDIELYDAVQRLRFEHPEVRTVVITSGKPKIFCAGANIRMLAASPHGWKVNFCKFTNETRNGIEDATANSGQTYLAAVNGTASGGGYELALACEHIMLVDDRSSAVSLPELPLLGVLPGTGGLTRVSDKRHVRRDLADYFSTKAEGVGGKKAVQWRLVDEAVPRPRWDETVAERAAELAGRSTRPAGAEGVMLTALTKTRDDDAITYEHVSARLHRDAGSVDITVKGPQAGPPAGIAEARRADFWPLAVTRELDDLILDLRTNEAELGTWVFRTEGDHALVLAHDALLLASSGDWFANEVLHYLKRTLRRLDVTSRSLLAVIEPGSCFAGSLLELALAADRSFQLAGVFEDEDPDAEPATITLGDVNAGPLTMSNGLTRLQTRFWGDEAGYEAAVKRLGAALEAEDAAELGLVTFAPDDIDWDEEIRIATEERASFSPDALTGLEANYRFAGPETMETKIFGRLTAWQNWIFNRPNASGPDGALRRFGTGQRAVFDRKRVRPVPAKHHGATADYTEKIPNNVSLHEDRRLQRALESWQPNFLTWWQTMGPTLPTQDVYLRTAVNVGRDGWAQFGHVAMPEYRWGIFLAERDPGRRVGFGEHKGEPVWDKVPGEYRAELQRLIVIQGDTEPASVEQQRNLGATAPSLYDLRNLFQVNVEEGRHLWAMVYLLHAYFGREGREEAEELLHRNSGSLDSPRILGAFNEETPDWLSFYMFTYFTDRDGKYQLGTLKESAFDPLSRTCEFMLKEEAHHMMVGTTGVDRVVQRTVEVMREHDTDDVAGLGAIPLPVIQKYLNFHYSVSLDLFGGETSTNVANYYTAGLKGRWLEDRRKDDHKLTSDAIMVEALLEDARTGQQSIGQTEVSALVGLNTDLRREYISDCQGGIKRWNRILEEGGVRQRLKLPHIAFNRKVGAFAGIEATPDGERLAADQWQRRQGDWLPTAVDKTYVRSLMQPVHQRGKIAAWIAPPRNGINGQPFDFDYVHLA